MLTPLHHLGAIYLFGNAHISVQALHRCAEEGKAVVFFDYGGKFRCRLVGPVCGNVLLRQAQYEAQRNPAATREIARSVVAGKIKNQRAVIARGAREAKDESAAILLRRTANDMANLLTLLPQLEEIDGVRGIEGQASALYFDAFDSLITAPPADFAFVVRTRRPPRDRVNALLSFLYALLTSSCTHACEGAGLDPQFGFLHVLRPGRPALALDLMEEFRAPLCDRLALTLINRRQIRPEHFDENPEAGGSVLLNADGRKIVLTAWHNRKAEDAHHPFLKDQAPFGLFPHLQARLLARHLRGDLPGYLPFLATP